MSEIQDQRSVQQSLLKTLQLSPAPKKMEPETFQGFFSPRQEALQKQVLKLQEKVERLKHFKTIVSCSVSHLCKYCLLNQDTEAFMEHLKACSSMEQPQLQVFEQEGKSFKIVIGQGQSTFSLRKKIQQIVELRNALTPFGLALESAKIFQIGDKSMLNGENPTVKVRRI